MLEILGILAFVFLILASIALHEIGHLVPAKKFNVRVPEYMVGFGPTIFSRVKGETRYGVKLFPLGGYIRMIGMLPPPPDAPEGTARSFTTGRAGSLIHTARQQSLEEITPEDTNRVFYRLPPWKRIIIMMGGPVMNLLLAIFLFTIIISGIGLGTPSLTVERVFPCVPTVGNAMGTSAETSNSECLAGTSAASAAGLRPGDAIVTFNGSEPQDWGELNGWIRDAGGETVSLTIQRDGQISSLSVDIPLADRPVLSERGRPTGEYLKTGYLGVQPKIEMVRQPLTSVPGYMADMTIAATKGLLSLPVRLYELMTQTLLGGEERSIDSPVSVVGASRIGGEVVASEQPIESKAMMFLGLAASVNLFLFLFNLLPILPLDGGHVAGAAYESARRKINKVLGRKDPGPVDIARMLPVAYGMASILIVVGAVVIFADLVKPLSLF